MLPAAPALAALNHLLGQAEWARERLRPFTGRHACIASPLLMLNFRVCDDGLLAATDDSTPPDVEIALPAPLPTDLLAEPDALFGRARVNGAADLAEALGFVLRNLKWDIEEDLSRVVGDITAHRLTGTLRSLTRWGKQAAGNLVGNFVEYLTEEQPSLVKAPELIELRQQIAEFERQLVQLDIRLGTIRNRP